MIAPMLATSARAAFDHPDWSWESKYDGFRLLARIRKPGHVELFSRNRHTFTALYRPIVEALQTLPRPAVLDGEAIMLGPDGRPSFEAMLALMERRPVPDAYLQYVVFDCLDVDGIPIMDHPLHERRQLLRKVLEPLKTNRVRMIDVFPGWQGTAFYEAIVQFGLEGVVGKRLASRYKPGERSPDWLKIPVRQREEFVVGGYVAKEGGGLAGLIVGRWNGDRKLVYEGIVGTGFSAGDRNALLKSIVLQNRCPFESVPDVRRRFSGAPRDVEPQWVRPALVVEVEFRQRTAEGLRHASFRGISVDKSEQAIR